MSLARNLLVTGWLVGSAAGLIACTAPAEGGATRPSDPARSDGSAQAGGGSGGRAAQLGGSGGSGGLAGATSDAAAAPGDGAAAEAEIAVPVEPSPSDGGGSGDGGTGGGAGPAALGPAGYVCPPGPFGDPLPPDARAVTIRSGFREAEGPVWLAARKVLLVSDIDERNLPNGSLFEFTPGSNTWRVLADKVGTNGMAIDTQGGVIAASHDTQMLMHVDPATGARTPVAGADKFEGRPFTETNDVVVRSDGNLYFTDPSFQPGAKGRAGQSTTAYYRLSPAGSLTRIAAVAAPNGIGLSPDGHWLYVVGGFPLRRHALDRDGAAAPEFTVLAQSTSDGMGVDCAGNIYLTTGTGVRVFAPDGKAMGMIAVPSSGFMTNVAFGGEDHRTLYITTRYGVHQVKVNVPGFPN